jgi:hypothetical protein
MEDWKKKNGRMEGKIKRLRDRETGRLRDEGTEGWRDWKR